MTTVTIGGRTADTYSGVLDTVIQQSSPTTTSGSVDRFQVSLAVAGQERKSLLQFTGLSNIVGPVTVSSVVLSLFRLNNVTAPNRLINCKKILRAATEAGASWNNYAAATPWQTAGALGALDIDNTVLATGTIPSTGNQRFTVSGAGLTALVQDVINGVVSNPWLILEVATATIESGDFDIASTQRATESQRPYMEVTFTPLTANASMPDVECTKFDGTVTVTVFLDAPAPVGGVNGTINTSDITAIAGVDYVAQTGVAFNIPEGDTTGDIVITLLP